MPNKPHPHSNSNYSKQPDSPTPKDLMRADIKEIAQSADRDLELRGFRNIREKAAAISMPPSTLSHLTQENHKATGLTDKNLERFEKATILSEETHALAKDYLRKKLGGVYGHVPRRWIKKHLPKSA